MIALGTSQALEGSATTASTVTYTITGLAANSATPPVGTAYQVLAQGQLASSAGSMYNPGGSATALISSINLFNTGSSLQTVNLYLGGSAGSNQIVTIVLPANGWAQYEDGQGWQVYTSAGLALTGGVLFVGGLGTPSGTAGSITVGTDTVVNGTLVGPLTASSMGVYPATNSWYQFTLTITKTAAGTATWTAKVKVGTAGTNSDSAIATFTSGTNTAVVDQMQLIINVVITALGSGTSATATCTANGVNSQTNVTGLGAIPGTPGSSAGFNSTAANYLHVDLNAGTSAVMTAWGFAEQLK